MKPALYILSFILFFSFELMTGQNISLSASNKKAAKNYKLAEDYYRKRDYNPTLEYLKIAVKKDNNFIEAWLLMGDVYTDLDRNKLAIDAFQNAIRIDSNFFPRAFYFIGNLAFKEGDYPMSAGYIKRYLCFKGEEEITRFIAKQRLLRAQFADSLITHPVAQKPENLGSTVNTVSDEYVNFVDEVLSKLILTRKSIVDTGSQGSKFYEESFYETDAANGRWGTPELIKLKWQEGRNLGGMSLSVDGRKMYFTGCDWPEGFGSCDLYYSFKKGNNWEAPSNLGSSINSQWWDSQPAVSADGKRIYFSSKRLDGRGGSDIWMTVRLGNGKWSPPINLGDSINTPGNEMSPFLHPDGKTLYFSSDGHLGLGGSDLFIARRDDLGRWSKARNLGYPINSSADDINLFMSLDGQWAFLSSDRDGGEGGYDIYKFETPVELRPQPVYFVKGIVMDKMTSKPLDAHIELTNLGDGLVVNEVNSDPVTGKFLMVLSPDEEYAFNITRPKYMFYSEHFSSLPVDQLHSVDKIFKIETVSPGKQITLNNVFFEFDKSDLSQKSYSELGKLFKLMEENPKIRIRISGYTDNVGDEDYNQKLSEARAKVVYQYLVDRGISAARLEFKGFGDTKPVADNNTEEGRALNRRTEVVVL